MIEENIVNQNLNSQNLNIPIEPTVVQDLPIKPKSKWLIFLGLFFLFILLIGALVYWFSPWFRNKQKMLGEQQNTNIRESMTVPINDEELSTVMTSAKEQISIDNFTVKLGENSAKSENQGDKEQGAEEIYQEVAESFAMELTDLQASSYERSQMALQITGNYKNEDDSIDPINLTFSAVDLFDVGSKQMQSDLIINGRFGDLVLNDGNMEAFHLSVINPEINKSLINMELSDYSMVLLDRIMNPDKERTAGSISVNSDEIYPYLNNYVQIESEPVVIDAVNTNVNEALIQNLLAKESVIAATTIGQIENYIVLDSEPRMSVDSSDLGLIYVQIDEGKLKQNYEEYWNQMDQYFRQNESLYFEQCGDDQFCLMNYGYLSHEDIEATKMSLQTFLSIFSINKAAIVADKQTFSYRGFAIELAQKNSIFSLLQLPFSDLKITLSIYSLPIQSEGIFQPQSVISLDQAPLDKNYGVSDQDNSLYKFNKAYVRTLSKSIWEALLVDGNSYCNIWWQPEFCFQNLSEMNIGDPEEYSDYISLNYPSSLDSTGPHVNIKIHPTDYEYVTSCLYDKKDSPSNYYEKYIDVKTKQGIYLRISALPKLSGTVDDSIRGQVCIQAGNSFSTKLPFSGFMEFYAEKMSFEDVASKLENLLTTLEIKGEINAALTNPPALSLESKDYPERKQSIRLGTEKFIINDVLQDKEVLFINDADSNDQSTCFMDDQYITNTYLDNQDSVVSAVFPNEQAVCIGAPTGASCIICKNGTWDWQEDLSACKGLRCNL